MEFLLEFVSTLYSYPWKQLAKRKINCQPTLDPEIT